MVLENEALQPPSVQAFSGSIHAAPVPTFPLTKLSFSYFLILLLFSEFVYILKKEKHTQACDSLKFGQKGL